MRGRQRHLRAALHLEHADGVGALQRVIDRRIVLRQIAPDRLLLVMHADQIERILQHRHHSQPQQIDLDDAHVGAVFFVPLHHDAPRHGRRLQRHDRIELALADHHAAGVLPQMARQIEEFCTISISGAPCG